MPGVLELLYRSKFGLIMSIFGNCVAKIQKPFMVYGYRDPKSGIFRKFTRMSSSATVINRRGLAIGNHVWVWHHSILDATEGIEIGDGCQIGAWVGIFTHGSERAIRLLGEKFVHIHNTEREGYTRGAVKLGKYTFVAAGSAILPGVAIGKGCLIGAGSLVTKDVPDYSIVAGMPAKVRGCALDLDRPFIEKGLCLDTYFDKKALGMIKASIAAEANGESRG